MRESINGEWRLIAETENEVKIPAHHVAFRFWAGESDLQGALINRATGAQVSLPFLVFNGDEAGAAFPTGLKRLAARLGKRTLFSEARA